MSENRFFPGSRARIRGTRFAGCGAPLQSRYDRSRDLPRLLPLLATDIPAPDSAATSIEVQMRLVGYLKRALKAERLRGQHGHWSYDLGRHSALLGAYRSEEADLRARQAVESGALPAGR